MPRRPPVRPRARTLVWLVLGALLLAQWLALVHAVVHPPVPSPLMTASTDPGPVPLVDIAAAHPDGSLACQLLDHLGQPAPWADPPAVAGTVCRPADPPSAPVAARPGGVAAGYHARGPPQAA